MLADIYQGMAKPEVVTRIEQQNGRICGMRNNNKPCQFSSHKKSTSAGALVKPLQSGNHHLRLCLQGIAAPTKLLDTISAVSNFSHYQQSTAVLSVL